MRILQVSASDTGGGAHRIANALHRGYLGLGHESAMAVRRRVTTDPGIYTIPPGISGPKRTVYRFMRRALKPAARLYPPLYPIKKAFSQPRPLGYLRAWWAGREFFDYPGSRRLLDLVPFDPQVVHAHNLHHLYFDLRTLPDLSARLPLAMTLHDEWTYTGHCGYTLGLETWRTGCRSCPDLDVYPRIGRDSTHGNWLAKRSIYRRSRLYVTAPSRWLLDRARESILAEGAAEFRHIPNGVDLDVYRPRGQAEARDILGLPRDRPILLFAANQVNTNQFKDYATVAKAVEQIAGASPGRHLLLLALGAEGPPTMVGNAELRLVPYETEPQRVAAYYQSADLYLHAAKADTFPTTVLEALACGRPVIATAVGGIGEQVRSLAGVAGGWSGVATTVDEATGVLVGHGDAAAMAAATNALLADDGLRARLGANAAADAAARFDVRDQVQATLAWYAEIVADWQAWQAGRTAAA